MSSESESLKRIYEETKKFVIIGLTGRTGSGCSTTAQLLRNHKPITTNKSSVYTSSNDIRKLTIINDFIVENWKPFVCIEVKTIITSKILEMNYNNFIQLLSETVNIEKESIKRSFDDFSHSYSNAFDKIISYKNLEDEEKKVKAYDIYFNFLPEFIIQFKKKLQELDIDAYTKLYQAVGDNIRASGTAFKSNFDSNKLFTIPRIINKLIKVIKKKYGEAFIVIDAIRNPYEAIFFQQRYSSFYLISINTPNKERINHLKESHKFSDEQIKNLDTKEYPKKLTGNDIYISQNIQKCIEISDIHLNNPSRSRHNLDELSSQLNWYISLIFHPGLVSPTQMERCMQIAYSAKLSSGCISRQVGAVVTDQNYSIKSVGWNSVPEGQTPCNLRTVKDIINNTFEKTVYSKYEIEDKNFKDLISESFSKSINHKNLLGRPISYCFKDIQNKLEGEKNQVHTRSLHAEENAFLQMAKYGGPAIENGILFSTASPCELCSKKAYQLGMTKAIYVDPYPGISEEHVLGNGIKEIELVLYRGAIGKTYHKLYQSLLSYKDELQILTGYEIKSKKEEEQKLRIETLENEVKKLKEENLHLKEDKTFYIGNPNFIKYFRVIK